MAKELENIQQKLEEKKKAKEQNTIEGLGWVREAKNGILTSKDDSSEDSVQQKVQVTIHNVETGMKILLEAAKIFKISRVYLGAVLSCILLPLNFLINKVKWRGGRGYFSSLSIPFRSNTSGPYNTPFITLPF